MPFSAVLREARRDDAPAAARPPRGPRAGRRPPRHRRAPHCSEAAGGGICILRGGPWPPMDVIEPRDPAEWSDWFEAMRFRTAISGGVRAPRPTGAWTWPPPNRRPPRHRRDALGLDALRLDDDGTGRRDRRRAHRSEVICHMRIVFITHSHTMQQRRQGVGRRRPGRVPDGAGLALGAPRLVGRRLPSCLAMDLFSPSPASCRATWRLNRSSDSARCLNAISDASAAASLSEASEDATTLQT